MRPTCIILYGLTLSALAVWRPNLQRHDVSLEAKAQGIIEQPPIYEFVARQKLKDIVMKKQEKNIVIVQSGLVGTWLYESTVENVVKPLKEEGWNIFYFVRLQREFAGIKRWNNIKLNNHHQSWRQIMYQNLSDAELCNTFGQAVMKAGGMATCQIFPADMAPKFDMMPSQFFHGNTKMTHACLIQFQQVLEIVLHAQRWMSEHDVTPKSMLRLREDAGWYLPLPAKYIEYHQDTAVMRACLYENADRHELSDKVELMPWKYALVWANGVANGYFTMQLDAKFERKVDNFEHFLKVVYKYYDIPYTTVKVNIQLNKESGNLDHKSFSLPVSDARMTVNGTMCYAALYSCRPKLMDDEAYPYCPLSDIEKRALRLTPKNRDNTSLE